VQLGGLDLLDRLPLRLMMLHLANWMRDGQVFQEESTMRYVSAEAGRQAGGGPETAWPVSSASAPLASSGPFRAHAQATTASRDAFATRNRRKNMTELSRADAPRKALAAHAKSVVTTTVLNPLIRDCQITNRFDDAQLNEVTE
jgi:hypothetical protein